MFYTLAAILILFWALAMGRQAKKSTALPGPVGRSHIKRSAVATTIVIALSLPCLMAAQGGFVGPGRYEIVNQKSGKVIDLDRNDQRSVIQFESRHTDNQIWDIRATGNGYYTFQSVMNGHALEAVTNNDSSQVQGTRLTGRASQQWRIQSGDGGTAVILSSSGKALDIAGASTNDGARVQIYTPNGNANQQFRFMRVDENYTGQPPMTSRSRTSVSPVLAGSASATNQGNRTELEPGWNMFSASQDVELGQQAANEIMQQMPMLNDARVDQYLNTLGHRLTANAPGFDFPYTFKAVNDKTINAFALPGGPIFINRGIIEAADTESQLAGVMAHEAAHVALRHGTNQASKASAAQMPLAILGGLLGSDSTGAALAQLGAGFTVNSILLKYSRDAESQADLMGTQMLYDAGFDPKGMSQFFQKLEGSSGTAFFNSHPNPENRVGNVDEEILRLGGPIRNAQRTSNEFTQIKRYVQSLPAPGPNQLTSQQQNMPSQPQGSSERFVTFQNSIMAINYPDNWRTYGQADAVTIAPQGGLVDDGAGNQAMAYGVLVNIYEPHAAAYGQSLRGPGSTQSATVSAQIATDQLIQELRQSNRNLRVVRRSDRIDFGGQRGLSTYLSNDSPVEGIGRETNWLVTVPRPEGLLFLVFTAPEREFQNYENVYQQMLYSVRVKQ